MPANDAFAFLATSAIPETLETLLKCEALLRDARDVETGALEGKIHDIVIGMLKDVNDTAVRMAGVSEGTIIKHMLETQSKNRPFTGDMESHVISEPGPLGNVKVALLAELEKIINPQGNWGPYWRAQEFGTGKDGVPSQVDRPLYGTFEPGGGPPDPQQAGLGRGTDLAFLPRGANPGVGRISVDLPGRHFLRDGSIEAGELYVEAMSAVSARWAKATEELIAQIPGALQGTSSHTFILRA